MRNTPAHRALVSVLDSYVESRWVAVNGHGSMGEQFTASAQADALWDAVERLHAITKEKEEPTRESKRRPGRPRKGRQP